VVLCDAVVVLCASGAVCCNEGGAHMSSPVSTWPSRSPITMMSNALLWSRLVGTEGKLAPFNFSRANNKGARNIHSKITRLKIYGG
jgi:hypothetical protein